MNQIKRIILNRYAFVTILGLIVISLILSLFLQYIESFRIVFGSFFVLFLPGFFIVELFFQEVDIIEKIALSFALSIAIVPLTVFYLNLIGIKINTLNSVLTIIGVIIISFIVRFIIDKIKSKIAF